MSLRSRFPCFSPVKPGQQDSAACCTRSRWFTGMTRVTNDGYRIDVDQSDLCSGPRAAIWRSELRYAWAQTSGGCSPHFIMRTWRTKRHFAVTLWALLGSHVLCACPEMSKDDLWEAADVRAWLTIPRRMVILRYIVQLTCIRRVGYVSYSCGSESFYSVERVFDKLL